MMATRAPWGCWQVRDWAQSHGMGHGHPASGLFFWAQLD